MEGRFIIEKLWNKNGSVVYGKTMYKSSIICTWMGHLSVMDGQTAPSGKTYNSLYIQAASGSTLHTCLKFLSQLILYPQTLFSWKLTDYRLHICNQFITLSGNGLDL